MSCLFPWKLKVFLQLELTFYANFSYENFYSLLGMLDFKGKAKWDAWNGKKGMSQDDAKAKYVEYANEMVTKHGLSS